MMLRGRRLSSSFLCLTLCLRLTVDCREENRRVECIDLPWFCEFKYQYNIIVSVDYGVCLLIKASYALSFAVIWAWLISDCDLRLALSSRFRRRRARCNKMVSGDVSGSEKNIRRNTGPDNHSSSHWLHLQFSAWMLKPATTGPKAGPRVAMLRQKRMTSTRSWKGTHQNPPRISWDKEF